MDLGRDFFYSMRTSGTDRKAIRLTDAIEEDSSHVIGRTQAKGLWGVQRDAPVYAKEHRYRVEFGTETAGRFNDGPSMVLNGVNNDTQARPHLERIAAELQELFHLDYRPNIYRDDAIFQQS